LTTDAWLGVEVTLTAIGGTFSEIPEFRLKIPLMSLLLAEKNAPDMGLGLGFWLGLGLGTWFLCLYFGTWALFWFV